LQTLVKIIADLLLTYPNSWIIIFVVRETKIGRFGRPAHRAAKESSTIRTSADPDSAFEELQFFQKTKRHTMFLPKGSELIEHVEAAQQAGANFEICADCGRKSTEVELIKINGFEAVCEDCFGN
jgi:hypothetical protein